MFYCFDGIDGAGKSTQLRLFCEWLAERGQSVVTCRDPGGTELGERVRSLLLHDETQVGLNAEMLLYMASRAQLVEQVIRPALDRGETIVSDRFVTANIVYQGHAGGLDVEQVRAVGQAATGGLRPDCTFLFDMDPDAALARIGREPDRIESRGADYRQKVRNGFLLEARRAPETMHVIDASGAVEEIQARIREIAAQLDASD
ncbi:MAG: dTMP kinase [Planctomycetota bacterium]